MKSYLVEGERDVAVIDTGTGAGDFPGLVASLSANGRVCCSRMDTGTTLGTATRSMRCSSIPAKSRVVAPRIPGAALHHGVQPGACGCGIHPGGFDPSVGMRGTEATGMIEHGDLIDLGNRVLEVIYTPGHSAGGVTFLDRKGRALFVADVVYLAGCTLLRGQRHAEAFRVSPGSPGCRPR